MPPSSRKRNKGKERKARQLAKKEENERADANTFWRSYCSIITAGCNHGYDVVISDDHPVSSFMDQFIMNFGVKEMTASQNLRELFRSHRHIWSNDNNRKSAIDILVRVGTSMLVTVQEESYNMPWVICLARSILVLEHYNGTDAVHLVLNKQVVITKGRDLDPVVDSERRDVLKFYRKRSSCKCLKKMHLEARKTTPKMGKCFHCKVVKERASLSVCSRCMIEQYCSRECQVAAWSAHERNCKILVRYNTSQQKKKDGLVAVRGNG